MTTEYDRAFRLMVQYECYPDVWAGKVFVEGTDCEVLVREFPTLLDAVKTVVLMAAELKLQGAMVPKCRNCHE